MTTITRYCFVFVMILSLVSSCRNDDSDKHSAHVTKETQLYTCPMHPEIIKGAPGSCPICGMDLVLKETETAPIEQLELETLLKPSNEFILSTIPVIAAEKKEESIALNVVGTVAYDPRQTATISSRVRGRIEKLYIRFKYQTVSRGQRVMDIYSPELVTAQQNLIFLLNNDRDNTSLINAAKERLILMGMTTNQVLEVIATKTAKYSVPVFSNYSGFAVDLASPAQDVMSNETVSPSYTNLELNVKQGMYVERGQGLFSVYDPAKAWILLDIFPEQQRLIKIGDAVKVVPEVAPQQHFRQNINYIEPVFRQNAKTLTARLYFNNTTMQLPIGSRVTATIFASFKNASWLPREAVFSLGRDKIVFKKERGGFRAHRIATGIELEHVVEVIGLTTIDSVASNAQFLVDNESFIKTSGR